MRRERNVRTELAMITALVVGMTGAAWADYIDEIEVTGKAVDQVKSVKVTFGDLNVDKDQGAEALYRRLQRASKMVCDISGAEKRRLTEVTAEAKLCYDTTLSGAVERLDKTLVTGIHEGR